MRGGEIFVGGNAGARAGISMKGGDLVVRGNSGFLTGFMMQKGRIVICGDVGHAVGDSMYEGVIYVGGEIGSLGSDAVVEETDEGELIELWDTLERHGVRRAAHIQEDRLLQEALPLRQPRTPGEDGHLTAPLIPYPADGERFRMRE